VFSRVDRGANGANVIGWLLDIGPDRLPEFRQAATIEGMGQSMPSEPVLVRRVLETGQERLLSADDVSQVTLDALQPRLAEALEHDLVVTIEGGFWLRARVDHGRLHARVWHGNQPQRTFHIATAVSRTSHEGVPVLELSLAGTHATVGEPDVILEMSDLAERLAWCWLLRFAG